MANTVKSYYAQTIDKPIIVLFWEFDEFVFFAVPLMLSLPTKQLLIGMFAGLLCVWGYMHIKKGAPANFVEHMMWKFGLIQKRGLPPPHIQEFLE